MPAADLPRPFSNPAAFGHTHAAGPTATSEQRGSTGDTATPSRPHVRSFRRASSSSGKAPEAGQQPLPAASEQARSRHAMPRHASQSYTAPGSHGHVPLADAKSVRSFEPTATNTGGEFLVLPTIDKIDPA